MVGPKASGEVLSVAYAGAGQHQDAGAKMVHAAPETTSKIVSKSISKDGGRTSYRGLVRVEDDAYGCKSHVQCDALILDEDSVSDTYPYMEVGARTPSIGHEATVSKVADEQLFYLMSRGLSEEQAMGMIVNGFIEPVTRTLPMEYAVEWCRLIELQMEGSVRLSRCPCARTASTSRAAPTQRRDRAEVRPRPRARGAVALPGRLPEVRAPAGRRRTGATARSSRRRRPTSREPARASPSCSTRPRTSSTRPGPRSSPRSRPSRPSKGSGSAASAASG